MPNPLAALSISERRRVVNSALRLIAARRWPALGEHILVQLPEVGRQREQAGHPDTPSGTGQAVRDVITAAIEGLRPDATHAPDPADRRWRSYLILRQCFIEGRPRNIVADALFIERGTYDHEQMRAINELAARLAEQTEAPAPPPAPHRRAAPPPPLEDILGRASVLEAIKARLAGGARALAVFGLPGIGKTTLLAALANDPDLAARFPDGILWTALGSQGDAGVALAEWAIALGAPTHEIGGMSDLTGRARAAHDAIGNRRVLLIADDVWEPAAALALRIGGPASACIISTRSPALAVDFAGPHALPLDALGDEDALALLARFAPEAVTARPESARDLCVAVGGLPLALTLIGSRLRHVGHAGQRRRIAGELDRLRETGARLTLARPEGPLERRPGQDPDSPTTLANVIALSDEPLDPHARAAWYALSVFPPQPNSFPEAAALAVADTTPATLDALIDAGLLVVEPGGRLRMHQTIADYGRLRLAADPATAAAVNARFTGYFSTLCDQAADQPERLAPDLINILAALDTAYTAGHDAALMRGALGASPLLLIRGEYALAERHLQRASLAAERADPRTQAATLMHLGFIRVKRGSYGEATALFERGLALAREADDRALCATLLQHLGHVATDLARYDEARLRYGECLALARAENDVRRIVEGLFFKALMHDQHSDYGEAERCLNEALPLARQIGHREFEANCLSGLGVLECKRGQVERGLERVRQGLVMARAIGHKEGIAVSCFVLGFGTQSLVGERAAETYYIEGLALAREIGHSRLMAMLLAAQGELIARRGPTAAAQARLMCDEAVEIARRAGHGHELSFALEQRASMTGMLGDPVAAQRDCAAAIAEARRIRSPEREAFAQARLAANQARAGAHGAAAITAARCIATLTRIGYGLAPILSYLRNARAIEDAARGGAAR